MKKLVVADYLGNSNHEGVPSGHVLKILREAEKVLAGEQEIVYIVTENYKEYLPELNIHHYVRYMDHSCSGLKKVLQRIAKITNIISILRTGNRIWFINIDFWFYLTLVFIPTIGKKLYATNYVDYYVGNNWTSKLKLLVYKKGNAKLKCEFTTAQCLHQRNQVYIPDYYFDEPVYNGYIKLDKKKQILFCGGISRAKDVEGLVRAFGQNGQPLKIEGQFESLALYEHICGRATSNIQISNKRLSDEEYYSGVGESKFIVLPYKRENYFGRSSGVILEAVFMDAVVIAPDFLLNELGIDGILYSNINELASFNINHVSVERCNEIIRNNCKFKERYSLRHVKNIYMTNID